MQNFRSAVFAAIIALSVGACQSGTKQDTEQNPAAGFKPATPEGTIQVSFTHENDTPQVKIHFTVGDKAKEKSFDLPLARDVDQEELFRTVWDKPNSCYVGVLKQNRTTRYYHASQGADGELKIFHVGTPPDTIWHYAEDVLGLGKVTARPDVQLTDSYRRNINSGTIIADFIVKLEPVAGTDSVQLYTEYGGANNRQSVPVPDGYVPKIQLTSRQDHCIVGLLKGDKFDGVIDVKVEGGHLKITELKRIY
jgi:hypothetical protein